MKNRVEEDDGAQLIHRFNVRPPGVTLDGALQLSGRFEEGALPSTTRQERKDAALTVEAVLRSPLTFISARGVRKGVRSGGLRMGPWP